MNKQVIVCVATAGINKKQFANCFIQTVDYFYKNKEALSDDMAELVTLQNEPDEKKVQKMHEIFDKMEHNVLSSKLKSTKYDKLAVNAMLYTTARNAGNGSVASNEREFPNNEESKVNESQVIGGIRSWDGSLNNSWGSRLDNSWDSNLYNSWNDSLADNGGNNEDFQRNWFFKALDECFATRIRTVLISGGFIVAGAAIGTVLTYAWLKSSMMKGAAGGGLVGAVLCGVIRLALKSF